MVKLMLLELLHSRIGLTAAIAPVPIGMTIRSNTDRLLPLGVDFSKVSLNRLKGVEILIATFPPTEVSDAARCLFHFDMANLRLM